MAPAHTSTAVATAALAASCTSVQAFVSPQVQPAGQTRDQRTSINVQTTEPTPSSSSASSSVVGLGLGVFAAATAASALTRRYVPAQNRSKTQLVAMQAFESELGVQAPVGYWDPLGLAADGDVEVFTRRRVTEIKHGRISMLATMGYITPELTGKLPGYLSPSMGLKFTDVPNGLGAISKVPAAGWAQIVAYAFFCEYSSDFGENMPSPGDYGFKPPLLATDDAELRTKRLNAEIANGRLSMMAIIGMFFQDGLTGSAYGDWALYTASPLRAFESELGVQAPVGYWDPLGLAADGDVEVFTRRRVTEIKHGRISMLATMGYITPELTGKLPGYLSPSMGLKFTDVPNGLGAISKVPAAGWAQIVAYAFFCEYSSDFGENMPSPGDYGFKPPLLATDDAELKTKRLNAEIANGRLSMMAIIGMFFQDGLTGSAYGDWALYTASPLRAFESELGVQAPVGYWDPLGLAADGDVEVFTRRRVTEIKHGRISMLATMGYITPELTGKLPGYLSPSMGLKFTDVPNGLGAISKVPAAGWAQIVAYAFFCEYSSDFGENMPSPGDYGFKPPLLATDDAELKTKRLNAEIANGRLSMMAIIGMFFQDGLTGSAYGDWALYTASPLRAFESELGVQAPVGYWDPLGLAADGDVEVFTRRRVTEIKHGRISMLATMGYITPELTGKLPGYLAPSMGLKFTDVPNGLGAISKVPAAGWAQIVAYAFFCEYSSDFGENMPSPGDYGFKPPLLATDDAELKTKRLNAEIANGRLSMMAIIGMFFQDGLTGSAYGDWALYTASPLRAFESELGVQAPVGYWDPLGLAADGDVEVFTRRRVTEIKHGRISMLATMGYITPELTGKLPGYLAPSMGLKFTDVPNGLGAISKVPAAGWAQIVAYAFFCEYSSDFGENMPSPGDYGFKPPLLATDDAELKTKRLNAEIANGRLSMMAIIGMFFQDGLTGSAYGDWALYTASPLRAFESELGVQAPVGYWDPLGLAADGDVEVFTRRRVTEIKHGRISMLATMGYITPELTGKLPGYLAPSMGLKFTDVPNGLGAISKVPAAGWAQIVAYAFFCEYSSDFGENMPSPGDYGFKPPLLATDDAELKTKRLNAEIANGRLSMMAIIGMFFQDGLTGSAYGDWALYTASPLRAFESELGVQAPVGYWDPLGLAADGDVEVFTRRRVTEIKHGRISMLATMGYITPELTGKLPGYLAPSMGLKFTDVPNGLGAISKVPAAGWAQIVAYAFFCEYSSDFGENMPSPGDYGFKPPLLATDDAELKTKRLNAEIANGRLSMMAIIGMFFQDGLTGSAYGDWALYTASPLRAFESELGVQAPVGYWDPLGLASDGDVEVFTRRRVTEIKHGRISMLATMGYITPELTGKLPGYLAPSMGLKFTDVPNGLGAISKVPAAGWAQIVAYAFFCEYSSDFGENMPSPGDYGFKPPLLATEDAELKTKRLNAEIANGRLSMMAIIGMFFQDGLTGSAYGDWALYTASPLRAFEGELGVQAPVGFFDPLGFTSDGDVDSFKRRRSVEIKHGRITMLATMGYITPELTGKFPGILSPSTGLKFTDVPNGLAALGKVPLTGWLQMAAYAGFCEAKAGYDEDIKSRTPGDMGWKPPLLATDDAETKKRRLNAELANGRLSMMAIIGMFFQDGLTGSAWGDWANYTDSPLRAFESELGVQAPVGFWDPVGFTKDGDVEDFNRRRGIEVKHGRIAMLATMGYITPELVGKFPGYLSPKLGIAYEDIPNGLAAISKVPTAGWEQILAYCFFVESTSDFGKSPDCGWKPPLLATEDATLKTKRLNAEIANGRLSMMAIIGMFFQDGLTGSAWGDWALYTDSPLRAFENELGVQAPTGFWDPAGFTADGSTDNFRRRRETEIKHGRISMLATMGYITPELVGKFPGYLSPTLGVKYEDIPNGLGAISKVPLFGWLQIIIYCLYCEASGLGFGYFDKATTGTPGDLGFKPPLLTSDDAEITKKRLNAEIANGRLSMMAIIGMFFQDGLTGSAWGDWALYTDSPLR